MGNLFTPVSVQKLQTASHVKVKAASITRRIGTTTESAVLRSWYNTLDCVLLCRVPCAKDVRLVREPDAGNLHVRFDERDVETE